MRITMYLSRNVCLKAFERRLKVPSGRIFWAPWKYSNYMKYWYNTIGILGYSFFAMYDILISAERSIIILILFHPLVLHTQKYRGMWSEAKSPPTIFISNKFLCIEFNTIGTVSFHQCDRISMLHRRYSCYYLSLSGALTLFFPCFASSCSTVANVKMVPGR